MTTDSPVPGFDQLGLSETILQALDAVGYETPSPIQAEVIPHVLQGRDVLGQAQTGTGKTAAFALPLLSKIDLKQREPQVLVLAPTRELAIQVAEAFQKYAATLKGFHVLPIYGGQAYAGQLKSLKRGVHVIVGTPGRVVDHIKRGTLKLDSLQCLVLDEADEMLRMGFIDDVEWVLAQTPEKRQVALFSATMPTAIRRIAEKHLHEPVQVTIKARTSTAENIRQRMWQVSGLHKLDALTRILEGEDFDGVIVFVRTKLATADLAEKLSARGHQASAINGDMDQRQRERTIEQFKAGKLDILVATDVVARGIDVDRVSHVVNYDIPYDTESYVHRIGRTGRAGRKGEAILFVAPRERRMLKAIERATKQPIEWMDLPSVEVINDKRIADFKQRIVDALASGEELEFFRRLIAEIEAEQAIPATDVAAALARQLQAGKPLLLKKEAPGKPRAEKAPDNRSKDRKSASRPPEEDMETYRIEVGHQHKVEPRNIVGAIANEAGLDSQHIGRIDIREDHSFIDLPVGMPKEVYKHLRKVWVAGRQLQIQKMGAGAESEAKPAVRKSHSGKHQAQGKGRSKPGGHKKAAHKGKRGPSKKS